MEAKELRIGNGFDSDAHHLNGHIRVATDLLSVEKSNIVEAANYGNRQEYYDGTEQTGEDYYNQTFSSLT